MSIEERLEKLEHMLEEILKRLEDLEARIGGKEATSIRAAARLVASGIAPAASALDAAKRLLDVLRRAGSMDPISRSIVEALSTCEELTISEVTRRVRDIRGAASRRIVSERLKALEGRGVVERVGGPRPRYRLVACSGQ